MRREKKKGEHQVISQEDTFMRGGKNGNGSFV